MCILYIVYYSTFILLACLLPFCVSPSSPLSYVLPVRTRELSVCLPVFLCIISASRKTTRQQFDEGNFQARNLFFTYFDIGSSSSFFSSARTLVPPCCTLIPQWIVHTSTINNNNTRYFFSALLLFYPLELPSVSELAFVFVFVFVCEMHTLRIYTLLATD